ncbi:MAG: YrzE family protein [Agathobacter sp.]|nr:YrzE family protein [Agathobacter sp.]
MINKNTIKSIILSLIIMGIVSIVTLVVLGVLTYTLKWQAPEAMVGITFTYIISGLVGGMMQGVLNRRVASILENSLELRERIISGLLLGTSYMFILLILSIVFTQNTNWDFTRLIVLWILLVCSSVLGSFLSNIFCKKH